MSDKKEFGSNFSFNEENFEDISSSSGKGDYFEDISSKSNNPDFVPFTDFTGGKHSAAKQKKYVVIEKINNWWHSLSAGLRATLTVLITVLVIAVNILFWMFPPFHVGYRGRTFLSACSLLGVDIAVFVCVLWKKRTFQRVLMIITAVITSALIIITTVLWTPFHKLMYNYNPNINLGGVTRIDEEIVNVALFGIDTRSPKNFSGLSDSIMILSLNTKTKTVKVISVMRDSLVPIKQNGKTTYAKINSAYSKGGPELAIQTLNNTFGLDITEYATVNFFGMVDIIDAVGGIDATITEDELAWKGSGHPNLNNAMDEICSAKKLNSSKYHIKKAGPQHLNGVQAVAYARVRNCQSIWGTNNDYGRTDRQRYVMEQLFNKATKMSKSDYRRLATSLIPCTETSLDIDNILDLAFSILLKSPKFEQLRIPQNSPEMNFIMPAPQGAFGSVVYYDIHYVAKLLHAVIYEDMTIEEYVAEHGVEKNDWYRKEVGGGSYQKPTEDTESNVSSTSSDTSTPPKKEDNSSVDTSSKEDEDTEDTSSDSSDTSSTEDESSQSEDTSSQEETESKTEE